MKNSRAKSKTGNRKPSSPRHPQPRRAPRTPYGLLQRKGPYRNLIEIPGMKGRTLERVEIYTATGHHSLTLDFDDKTSVSFLLDPCLFITAELSDISSGNERFLKRWPKIKSISGNE
jgi:hypothetical protein